MEQKYITDYYITKASGERELFDIKKVQRSLERAGARPELIAQISERIMTERPFETSKGIHRFIGRQIKKLHKGVAGRYRLKDALMGLGPTGYPFEKFIGHIFKAKGYSVQLDVIAPGYCINHELDVVVQKDNEHFMVECKFHNRHGIKTSVRVPLYVKARFDDVRQHWEKSTDHKTKFHQAWVVTNTKLTYDAIQYSECVGIKAISWSYPSDESLAHMIDKFALYPITILSSLSGQQKKYLVETGVVLCKQILEKQQLLAPLNMTDSTIKKVVDECRAVCELKK